MHIQKVTVAIYSVPSFASSMVEAIARLDGMLHD